jgi:hypothetical protein
MSQSAKSRLSPDGSIDGHDPRSLAWILDVNSCARSHDSSDSHLTVCDAEMRYYSTITVDANAKPL